MRILLIALLFILAGCKETITNYQIPDAYLAYGDSGFGEKCYEVPSLFVCVSDTPRESTSVYLNTGGYEGVYMPAWKTMYILGAMLDGQMYAENQCVVGNEFLHHLQKTATVTRTGQYLPWGDPDKIPKMVY